MYQLEGIKDPGRFGWIPLGRYSSEGEVMKAAEHYKAKGWEVLWYEIKPR